MKLTATIMMTLILMIGTAATAKAQGPNNGKSQIVNQSANTAPVNADEQNTVKDAANSNAPTAPEQCKTQIIKQGDIIQDGNLIIIKNRPVRLYA